MKTIGIEEIENGYTVYINGKTVFCSNSVEVIKKVAEIMNIEIVVDIREKKVKEE